MAVKSSMLFSSLRDIPLLTVPMANVTVMRLDRVGGAAPGNKSFKLRHSLQRARRQGLRRILSFGGAWSNHLHALAAVGAEMGMETIAVVRGGEVDTPMLQDARRWGMHIVPVSRTQYRRRSDPEWCEELAQRFAPCLVIPEGGASGDGVRGCLEIGRLIRDSGRRFTRVVLPVGTGTTLAGLVADLEPDIEVVGISALRGARDLEQRVLASLDESGLVPRASWRILHHYHCGGFARTNAALRSFMLAFEDAQAIALEPVYTGKLFYAIHAQLDTAAWSPDEPILAIHTGGLQGRRGFPWLSGDQSG